MDPKACSGSDFIAATGVHDFAEERRFDFEQETLEQPLLCKFFFRVISKLILDPKGNELRQRLIGGGGIVKGRFCGEVVELNALPASQESCVFEGVS